MVSKEVCRLCLNESSDFDSLDSYIEKLQTISLDLDLALTDEPVICRKCLDILWQMYNFKTRCLDNDKYLKTVHSNPSVKVTLEEIIPRSVDNKYEEESVCRFCLRYHSNESFVKLDNVEDDMFLKDMLLKCLPEITLGLTHRSLICDDCMENLQTQFNFIITCLDAEEKIKSYTHKVDLKNVLNDCRNYKAEFNYVKLEENAQDSNIINGEAVVKTEKPEHIAEDEYHVQLDKNPPSDVPNSVESETAAGNDGALKRFRCLHCPFASNYKNRYNSHVSVIHQTDSAETFHCELCNYKSYYKHNLSIHRRMHEGRIDEKNKLYRCVKCGKGFNKKNHLNGHILKNHTDLHHLIKGRIYSCDSCSYTTVYTTHLSRHISYNHSKSAAEKYYCEKCDYSCLQKNALSRHVLTHTEFKPFVCPDCKKGFNQKRLLDSHILCKHKDNPELVKTITNKMKCCELCSFRSIEVSYLKTHMKVCHKGS